jgi:hypothetical protein
MPPKRKKKIAGQLRVSSKKQKDEATIEDQYNYLKDLFTRIGIFDGTHPDYEFHPYDPANHTPENPSFFVDEAYSIEEEDPSTKFYDLCRRIDSGLIDVVGVYATNRIFRAQDEVFRAKIVRTFRLARAMIFVNGVERNPSDIASIVEQHLSSEDKTRLLRNCHQGKTRKAEKEGAPPSGQHKFGFRWLNHRQDRKWIEVPRDLETVRWAGCLSAGIVDPKMPPVFLQALNERPIGFSDEEIVDLLNSNGFSIKQHLEECRLVYRLSKNPTGKIGRDTVRKFLTDTAYAGLLQYSFMKPEEIRPASEKGLTGDKRTVTWNVPPVFSQEEWSLIQDRRTERSAYARRNVVKEYLLKDFIECAHCGKLMAARQGTSVKRGQRLSNDGRSWYYTCSRKQHASETGRCTNISCFNGRALEPQVWNTVCKYISDPQQVAGLISPESNQDTKLLKNLEDALVAEQNKLTPIQKKIGRINELAVDGLLDPHEALTQKQRVLYEIEAIERGIAKYRSLIRKKKEAIKTAKIVDLSKIRGQVGSRLSTLSFEERRMVISHIVDKLTINKEKKVEIRLRPFIAATQI